MIIIYFSPTDIEDINQYLLKALAFILIQTIYLFYIFDTRPHTVSIFNRLEFINESGLILLGYVMLIFSGLTPIDDLLANSTSYNVAVFAGVVIAIIIFVVNYFVMIRKTIERILLCLARRK